MNLAGVGEDGAEEEHSSTHKTKYLFRNVCVCVQLCLTLWDPMDCNPPVSSVHGISQARILE